MKWLRWAGIGLMAGLLAVPTAWAEGKLVYEMQDIQVEYAAEFKAYPVDAAGNRIVTAPKPTVGQAVYGSNGVTGSVYGSVTDSVYGGQPPVAHPPVPSEDPNVLTVLYGIVRLTNGNGYSFKEEFIKVQDSEGFERALSNGGTTEYFPGSYRFSKQFTNFAVGKKLEGSAVVKDYVGPWRTINLMRSFDEYQNLNGLKLWFESNGKSADPFWEKLMSNRYEVDLSTYKYAGNQGAVK